MLGNVEELPSKKSDANALFGLNLSSDSGWSGNTIRSDSGIPGSNTGVGGVELGPNLCDGDTTCP